MSDQLCAHCGNAVPPTTERCDACGAWQAAPPPVAPPEGAETEGSDRPWWDPGEPYWERQKQAGPPVPGLAQDPPAPVTPPGPAEAADPASADTTTAAPPPAAPPQVEAPAFPEPPPPPPGYPASPATFGPPPEQPRPRSSKRGPILAGAAILAAIAVVAAGSVVLLGGKSSPNHPDHWDPRIAPIAQWVARERKLSFLHPVYVDFLTPAQYRAASTTSEDDLSPQDKAELDQYAGAWRAIGLAQGKVDLGSSMNEVSDTGTLAFYDPDDQRVRVRGTKLTPGVRVTLAHELTHALQDQHFDLKQLYNDSSRLQPDSYDTQLRAVVEGDAEDIEQRYIDEQLTSEERRAYEKQSEDEGKAANDKLQKASVPPGLLGTFSAPYWFGPRFVTMIEQERGAKAVDEAIRVPPSSSEQMFDPLAYLNGDRPVTVDPVKVPAGATVIDQGPFGSVQWFLMLAERIKPATALRAVDGWGGDSQAVWTQHGKVCIGANFSGDTPDDDDEMVDALNRWSKAMPAGTAEVSHGHGVVSFRSCDPGSSAKLHVTGRSGDALAYPAVRTDIATATLSEGASTDQAGCFGTQIVSELTPAQLTEDTTFFESVDFDRLVTDARVRCQ
ncbi:MAG: hypothetical protein JO291_04390 [Acidimicrobiia bacterium]|nr:hypothetical protein [Acidimicrobiia bacterium]